MWGFSGSLNFTSSLNFAISLLCFLHFLKRLCLCVHISATNAIRQKPITCYQSGILVYQFRFGMLTSPRLEIYYIDYLLNTRLRNGNSQSFFSNPSDTQNNFRSWEIKVLCLPRIQHMHGTYLSCKTLWNIILAVKRFLKRCKKTALIFERAEKRRPNYLRLSKTKRYKKTH